MPQPTPKAVDTTEVRKLRAAGHPVRLIDVRSPGEFARAHIPGSANVPLELLRASEKELVTRHDDTVVLVCASGARAEQARGLLESAGMDRVSVLHGGITAWEGAGGELNCGRGAWALERQVRLAAGLIVLVGVLAGVAYDPLKWIAGMIGAGLTFAALTNTCAMSRVLGLLPINRAAATGAAVTLDPLTAASGPRSAG